MRFYGKVICSEKHEERRGGREKETYTKRERIRKEEKHEKKRGEKGKA